MKILFTVAFLDGLHGSVKHVLEYSSFFASKAEKNEVFVATIFFSDKIRKKFTDRGINVCTIDEINIENFYDIVFAYHFPVIEALLHKGLNCKKLILGSLSSFVDIETFPLWWPAASMRTVISEECKQAHHKKYGIPLESMYVVENSIPDEFSVYPPVYKHTPPPPHTHTHIHSITPAVVCHAE
ncbi:hypothetical protein [uncultured Mailhella sp.]|uniref:hypothetical protein n=1 Tax=uncultured Mailhella sp. TaxID=1981031 RepID=UPI00260D74B1|nr:hypothetical protein [uncultured Mailhella sp.]